MGTILSYSNYIFSWDNDPRDSTIPVELNENSTIPVELNENSTIPVELNENSTIPVEDPDINSSHEMHEPYIPNKDVITESPRMEEMPPTVTSYHTDDVDRKNIYVICAGKSTEIIMFPSERISVLLQEACDHLGKKPQNMSLIFQGERLNVDNKLNQYPSLRRGSKVNLIYAS